MYHKELEELAIDLNKKYYPNRLEKIEPVDVYEFAEKLSIDYEWKYITPDESILGLIFFEDGAWFVWSNGNYKDGDKPKKESFKKGTIVINQVLLDTKQIQKENFAVCHEIMHYIKDQDFFINRDGGLLQICSANSFKKTSWNNKMDPLEIVESQTNYLTAAFLMPEESFKKEFFKVGKYKNIPNKPIVFQTYMKGWIRKLADELHLNYNPVLYRLYDLNILERP